MTKTDARRVGRYVLLEEFAAGGMATVHYGHMTGSAGFRRIVAIKRMRASLKAEAGARDMLLDEGRLAARVQHGNVVQTLDVVVDGDELLLVLEYVTGESLDKLIKAAATARTPIPEGIVVAIVSGALRGLHAAHLARGEDGQPLDLVHRDVSPHNILLDVSGVPRVTDFGIAKARGRIQSTQTGTLKGKLAYVAPEQIHGQSSPASDVFSTGIVLWETLSLSRLFKGSNEAEVLSAVLRCEVPPISGADPVLQKIARTALSRIPEQRYPSAIAMAEALEATGLWASPSEISAWMRALVPEVLTRREARVRALEQDSYSTLDAVRPATSRRALFLGAGVGLLAVVGVLGASLLRTEVAPEQAVPVPAPLVIAPKVIDAGPVEVPVEVVLAPTPPPATVVDAGVRLKPKVTAKPKADCAVPYTLDRNGRKKYKMECL